MDRLFAALFRCLVEDGFCCWLYSECLASELVPSFDYREDWIKVLFFLVTTVGLWIELDLTSCF